MGPYVDKGPISIQSSAAAMAGASRLCQFLWHTLPVILSDYKERYDESGRKIVGSNRIASFKQNWLILTIK
jgi:hypothetical protein